MPPSNSSLCGGQERGLRPGTLPVALIVALGAAAETALRDHAKRAARCKEVRKAAWEALEAAGAVINGDTEQSLPHVLNVSFPGIDSEALMVALKDMVAVSNGSACTSSSYTPSHVLLAMGRGEDEANEAVRLSWCHLTPEVDWREFAARVRRLR